MLLSIKVIIPNAERLPLSILALEKCAGVILYSVSVFLTSVWSKFEEKFV